MPVWRAAVFWPFIVPDGRRLASCFVDVEVFHPFVTSPAVVPEYEGAFKLMKGYTRFPFLALAIKSDGSGVLRPGKIHCPDSVLLRYS